MMEIGVFIHIHEDTDIMQEFQKIRNMGLRSCQVSIWDTRLYTAENAEAIREAQAGTGVNVSALWAGWSGPQVWDFYEGPLTLGLVPGAYRHARLKELLAASDFAEKLQVSDVVTHAGFLPENPNDPDYTGVISVLRYLAGYMKEKGQYFLFESGQETPTTLVRTIGDVGTGNLGINFDTANVILYGKANPADAAGVFGRYVRNMHCKDGEFPVDGRNLGREVPLGQGRANLPQVLQILVNAGYRGPLTIEREISGEQQIRDIEWARDYLTEILKNLEPRS